MTNWHFNPRSREGSDFFCLWFCGCFCRFQSTLPRGERLHFFQALLTNPYFNPRSREGSDFPTAISRRWQGYFNPRSREGSDDIPLITPRHKFKISIHAPARGATSYSFDYSVAFIYFNPRSREGSDQKVHSGKDGHALYFNPRSREGSDSLLLYIHTAYVVISIHAPARGATAIKGGMLLLSPFQSTLPRGERLGMTEFRIVGDKFQSTLPRGERLCMGVSTRCRCA